jgi:hypothetical protein
MTRTPNALDYVQLVGMRKPSAVNPCFFVETDGVDDESFSLVPAYGVPHPGKLRIFGMLAPIGEDLTYMVIELELFNDAPRSLNHLKRKGLNINPWHTGRKAPDVLTCGWINVICGISE